MLELLAKQVAGGRTVVLVTHEPRFASFADRILHVRDGEVFESSDATTEYRPREARFDDEDDVS